MIFECNEIEVKDDRGRIEARGIEWTEASTVTETMVFWLAYAAFGFAMLTGALAAAAVMMNKLDIALMLGIFTGGVVAAAYGLCWLGWRVPAKRKQVIFSRSGEVTSSEHGLWSTKVQDLRSIEAEQLHQKKKEDDLPYTHGVRILTRRGRVIHLAKDLEPDDAITLAVMLSEAVEAVKFEEFNGRAASGGVY